MVIALQKVQVGDKLWYRDDRLMEFRAVDDPCERITFKQILREYISVLCQLSNAMNTLVPEPEHEYEPQPEPEG